MFPLFKEILLLNSSSDSTSNLNSKKKVLQDLIEKSSLNIPNNLEEKNETIEIKDEKFDFNEESLHNLNQESVSNHSIISIDTIDSSSSPNIISLINELNTVEDIFYYLKYYETGNENIFENIQFSLPFNWNKSDSLKENFLSFFSSIKIISKKNSSTSSTRTIYVRNKNYYYYLFEQYTYYNNNNQSLPLIFNPQSHSISYTPLIDEQITRNYENIIDSSSTPFPTDTSSLLSDNTSQTSNEIPSSNLPIYENIPSSVDSSSNTTLINETKEAIKTYYNSFFNKSKNILKNIDEEEMEEKIEENIINEETNSNSINNIEENNYNFLINIIKKIFVFHMSFVNFLLFFFFIINFFIFTFLFKKFPNSSFIFLIIFILIYFEWNLILKYEGIIKERDSNRLRVEILDDLITKKSYYDSSVFTSSSTSSNDLNKNSPFSPKLDNILAPTSSPTLHPTLLGHDFSDNVAWANVFMMSIWTILDDNGEIIGGLGKYMSEVYEELFLEELDKLSSKIGNIKLKKFNFGTKSPIFKKIYLNIIRNSTCLVDFNEKLKAKNYQKLKKSNLNINNKNFLGPNSVINNIKNMLFLELNNQAYNKNFDFFYEEPDDNTFLIDIDEENGIINNQNSNLYLDQEIIKDDISKKNFYNRFLSFITKSSNKNNQNNKKILENIKKSNKKLLNSIKNEKNINFNNNNIKIIKNYFHENCDYLLFYFDIIYSSNDMNIKISLSTNTNKDMYTVVPDLTLSLNDVVFEGIIEMKIFLTNDYPFLGNSTVSSFHFLYHFILLFIFQNFTFLF